jgi:hypothetical protein
MKFDEPQSVPRTHSLMIMRAAYNAFQLRRLAYRYTTLRTSYFTTTATIDFHKRNMSTTTADIHAADASRVEATNTKTGTTPLLTTVSGSISALSGPDPKIDLEHVGAAEAKTLMSAEHKALGYRPPPGSLAAEAQAAAAKHPDEHLDVDANTLRELAKQDAARIAKERQASEGGAAATAGSGSAFVSAPISGTASHANIDMDKIGEGN